MANEINNNETISNERLYQLYHRVEQRIEDLEVTVCDLLKTITEVWDSYPRDFKESLTHPEQNDGEWNRVKTRVDQLING